MNNVISILNIVIYTNISSYKLLYEYNILYIYHLFFKIKFKFFKIIKVINSNNSIFYRIQEYTSIYVIRLYVYMHSYNIDNFILKLLNYIIIIIT